MKIRSGLLLALILTLLPAAHYFDSIVTKPSDSLSLAHHWVGDDGNSFFERKLEEPFIFNIQSDTYASDVLEITGRSAKFPGSIFLKFSIREGTATVTWDDKEIHLAPQNERCKKNGSAWDCSVLIENSRSNDSFKVYVTAKDRAIALSNIRIDSVNAHQKVIPTNFSVVILLIIMLPISILIGFVKSSGLRILAITLSSICFIALLSVHLLAFILLYLVLTYLVIRSLQKAKHFLLSVSLLLGLSLVTIKVVWPIIGSIFDIPLNFILIPIGFSYLIARQVELAYGIASKTTIMPTLVDYFSKNLLWTSFAAGPITRLDRLDIRASDGLWEERKVGLPLFFRGLSKKLGADLIFLFLVKRNFEDVVLLNGAGSGLILLFFFANMLFVYFDFSGYTDMVRGSSKVMGINLPENFRNPLFKNNMREFWKNWHISLTQWVNRVVFMPISFSLRREGKIVAYALPVFLTTLSMGLFHGFQSVWIYWAIHHAVGIFLTDFARKGHMIAQSYSKNPLSGFHQSVGKFGFLFVWFWLMLSYTFTVVSDPVLSLELYSRILIAPVDLLLNMGIYFLE